MGLSYFIVPDKKVSCEDRFPEGLSLFFQQIGGYHGNSEVSQVSKILDIDLNAFQNCDQDFEIRNTAEEKPFWQNIDSFSRLIDDFLAKIAESPDYYKFVRHRKDHRKYSQKVQQALNVKRGRRYVSS